MPIEQEGNGPTNLHGAMFFYLIDSQKSESTHPYKYIPQVMFRILGAFTLPIQKLNDL